MALDLEAIRRKLAALNGQRNQRSNVNLWKPPIGEYRVRILPWPAKLNDGDGPFIERSFYFIGENKGFLAPKQFGKPDPVEELIKRCHNEGDKETAKKLYPKNYAYAAIIVRGEEDKGIYVWKLSKMLNQRVLGFFLDEDGGDITHPDNGCDLKVKVFQTPGKQFLDTEIDMRKNSPLHTDPAQAQKWLDAVPNLDELFERQKAHRTEGEIKRILEDWIDGKPATDGWKSNATEGTAKGTPEGENAVDKLAKDLSEGKKKQDAKKVDEVQSKKASTKAVDDDDDDVEKSDVKAASKKALDDAFADLMAD